MQCYLYTVSWHYIITALQSKSLSFQWAPMCPIAQINCRLSVYNHCSTNAAIMGCITTARACSAPPISVLHARYVSTYTNLSVLAKAYYMTADLALCLPSPPSPLTLGTYLSVLVHGRKGVPSSSPLPSHLPPGIYLSVLAHGIEGMPPPPPSPHLSVLAHGVEGVPPSSPIPPGIPTSLYWHMGLKACPPPPPSPQVYLPLCTGTWGWRRMIHRLGRSHWWRTLYPKMSPLSCGSPQGGGGRTGSWGSLSAGGGRGGGWRCVLFSNTEALWLHGGNCELIRLTLFFM